jgi:hypothetical protein
MGEEWRLLFPSNRSPMHPTQIGKIDRAVRGGKEEKRGKKE